MNSESFFLGLSVGVFTAVILYVSHSIGRESGINYCKANPVECRVESKQGGN